MTETQAGSASLVIRLHWYVLGGDVCLYLEAEGAGRFYTGPGGGLLCVAMNHICFPLSAVPI